jgi:hypothetical protein
VVVLTDAHVGATKPLFQNIAALNEVMNQD